MRNTLLICLFSIVLHGSVWAAPKPHVISFGKWTTVKWFVGPNEDKGADLKVRALLVDTRLKEFTLGLPHEVTDRLFVVRRAYRMNDSLPEESPSVPRWRWQRGGWLLVDRVTGRVTALNLAEFDAYYSVASWYRDYVAYCGVSDDGKKLSAMVVQLGRRKPILHKALGAAASDDEPDSACPPPQWSRGPVQVAFEPAQNQKLTYAVRGHAVDVVNETEDDDEEASK